MTRDKHTDVDEDRSGETAKNAESKQKSQAGIPNIKYFDRTYGISCEGNDRKAVKLFKSYETQEKLRRLQRELQLVTEGKIPDSLCDTVIGKKRFHRYGGYAKWARTMMIWITERSQTA